MRPVDPVERLSRAKDLLESISDYTYLQSYPTQDNLRDYNSTLESVAGLGYDISDFKLDNLRRTEGGNVPRPVFEPRRKAFLGFIEREVLRLAPLLAVSLEAAKDGRPPDKKLVFLVHGQDTDAVETITLLLKEVGLEPKGFREARRLTADPLPYIGDVLNVAFNHAQAVLVIFTPDERVELSAQLQPDRRAISVEHQPRPNVLIEAGIALTTHPKRVVILEMGKIRAISDLAGRHVVRWNQDTPEERSELLDRLEDAGCELSRDGTRWMSVGRNASPTWM